MKYEIMPEEWDYTCNPNGRYIDENNGFMVEVFHYDSGAIAFGGSSMSYFDDGNIYYYDVASDGNARPYLMKFSPETFLNDDGEVCESLTISSDFIARMDEFMRIDEELQAAAYEFAVFAASNRLKVTGDALMKNCERWVKLYGEALAPDEFAENLADYVEEFYMHDDRIRL